MENNWNSVLTIKSKKKKSVAKSQNGHTMLQTKPPSTKLTGSAVPSCLSDHEPMELKDINGNDKFVQFGDVKEEIVENEGLSNFVDLQHPTIAMQQEEISIMSKCMAEKDKTIAKLQSQLGAISANYELQFEQLLWLNSVVNEVEDTVKRQEKVMRLLKESRDIAEYDVVNKEIEIIALECSLSDKSALCEEQASNITSLEKKAELLEIKLEMLRKDDQLSKCLIDRQKQLANSTMALLARDKKTKHITAHTVAYVTTEPSSQVVDEVAAARQRLQGKQDKEDLARLVNIVDTLAQKYCPGHIRYGKSHPSNDSDNQESVTNPDDLPPAVPVEFFGLWIFAKEPTQEEVKEYDSFLARQLPKPIYSPTLPKLHVNWMRLNTNMFRNLPQPTRCTVYGCSQDPAAYTRTYRTAIGSENVFDDGVNPFGALYGFHTDQGVVDLPDIPIHGYKFDVTCRKWVIAASVGY